MSYRGNRDYKLDCNKKIWLYITRDCSFEPRYDKESMRYINRCRRMRDKNNIRKELAEI